MKFSFWKSSGHKKHRREPNPPPELFHAPKSSREMDSRAQSLSTTQQDSEFMWIISHPDGSFSTHKPETLKLHHAEELKLGVEYRIER